MVSPDNFDVSFDPVVSFDLDSFPDLIVSKEPVASFDLVVSADFVVPVSTPEGSFDLDLSSDLTASPERCCVPFEFLSSLDFLPKPLKLLYKHDYIKGRTDSLWIGVTSPFLNISNYSVSATIT
ncbi:unnamed protein product [Strongylus vulgaris]|uniref:Uncharacterized protein n=1 Tax=Strongylus vulgaris TaxID=40348 RepID=A0A3P7IT11_STRVU|nr:unnamed protein product [Strongylus vulgaris]